MRSSQRLIEWLRMKKDAFLPTHLLIGANLTFLRRLGSVTVKECAAFSHAADFSLSLLPSHTEVAGEKQSSHSPEQGSNTREVFLNTR